MSLMSPVISQAYKLRHKHPVVFFCSAKLSNEIAKTVWLVPQDVVNILFFNEEMCSYYSLILNEKLTVVDEYGHSIVESYEDDKVSPINYDFQCKRLVIAALMKLVNRATINSNNLGIEVVNIVLKISLFNVLDAILENSTMDNGPLDMHVYLLADLARSFECSQYMYNNRGRDVMKQLASVDDPNVMSGKHKPYTNTST